MKKTISLASIDGLFLQEYERQLQYIFNLLEKNIDKNSWSLDIGSSIGSSVIPIALLCEKAIAFEADISRYLLLNTNIKNNDLSSKIDTWNFAAYNKDAVLDFYNTHTRDNGSVANFCSNKHECNPAKVFAVDLYKFLSDKYSEEDLSKIKFIKIDAEGCDALILENLKPLIDKNKPKIMCELFYNGLLDEDLRKSIELINYQSYTPEGKKVMLPFDEKNGKRPGELILLPK